MKWVKEFKIMGKEVRENVMDVYGTENAVQSFGTGAGGDETCLIDKVAEDTLLEHLRSLNRDLMVISEEIGELVIGKDPEYYVFIDPIDGSNNAEVEIPIFATAYAVSKSRKMKDLIAGYVGGIACPFKFYARRGKGAFMNGKRLKPSQRDDIDLFSFHLGRNGNGLDQIIPIIRKSRHVRSIGSIALTLCHIASGGIEAYADFRPMRLLDIVPPRLILEESGAVIKGLGFDLDDVEITTTVKGNFMAASNPRVFKLLEDILEAKEP
jgi:myo-inositol-1(or 4)-monophosphatase